MGLLDPIIPLLWAMGFVMAWSLLYRENFAFRVAEHVTIGLFLGFTIYVGLDIIYKRVFLAASDYAAGTITAGAMVSVYIAAILGVVMWTRLYEPTQWVSRWPIATLTGIGAAISIRGAIEASLVKQLVVPSWTAGGMDTVNAIIIAVGTFAVISYFLFTHKQVGPLYVSALFGRIIMMVAFGVSLGMFLMSNIAFAVGQMYMLMKWPAIIVTILACAAVAYDVFVGKWPGPFAPKTETE